VLFEEEYVAARREATRRNFTVALDGFERICKPTTLASVTERTLSRYAAGLRKLPGQRKGSDGMMASTIRVRLQFLRTALQWAVGQKLLPARPAFPTVKVPKKDPQPVPAEAFERLLARADDDGLRAYLLCGWLAGLRLTEAYLLEWEENEKAPYVDLARDRLILPAEFVKGDKDSWVPLDADLREALLRLPRHGKRVFRFVNSQGVLIGAPGVSQRVQELAVRARVNLTMKSLRRGFACRYAAKVPAQVLQRLMRHASITTTMKYYANVDAAVEEAVLGPRRNDSRNKPHSGAELRPAEEDVSD
jgi:integrase